MGGIMGMGLIVGIRPWASLWLFGLGSRLAALSRCFVTIGRTTPRNLF
jgi:hypothetical protein